jgi:CRISPR-associated endonuclease/helicase Cas3
MREEVYAHSLPGCPKSQWHPLSVHLENVARKAAAFASAFGAEQWGYVAGFAHDLGKFAEGFQRYLQTVTDYHRAELDDSRDYPVTEVRVDHSSAGAQECVREFGLLGHLLAFVVSGHHAGLLDAISDGACLDRRLRKRLEPLPQEGVKLLKLPRLELPAFLSKALCRRSAEPERVAFSFAFFVRMLFSCLVDADFLDTESFMQPQQAKSRPEWPHDILIRMEEALNNYIQGIPTSDNFVDRRRRQVRECCLRAAEETPGLFSLTVPTGGGKTLSSLAFALRHARINKLRRVIYVVPFTTIIEQNADVFRSVFSRIVESGIPDPVIEHHSNLDPLHESLENRLSAENWAAPLIVTTSVQFYESLFGHHPSRCRKLHNIARSVIILDEVQKIPVDHLSPILAALEELAKNYGCSIVLCTATQPALHWRKDFPVGLQGIREIVTDPVELYHVLKRVTLTNLGFLNDAELADLIGKHQQVLCIVNTRAHARRLHELLRGKEGVFHLSAAMCPEHRAKVLREVISGLENGECCRVVATQLVEAGVDVDFPVVYRSLAGLDSIAQAAGRCNRNGHLERGKTFLFTSEDSNSEGFLRDMTNVTKEMLGGEEGRPLYKDLLSLPAVEHYFRIYYWQNSARWDHYKIIPDFALQNCPDLPFLFAFRSVSDSFKIIRDASKSVIVPWRDRGQELAKRIRSSDEVLDYMSLRELQRFIVQIPEKVFMCNLDRTIELIQDRFAVLVSPGLHYSDEVGLILERHDYRSDEFLI